MTISIHSHLILVYLHQCNRGMLRRYLKCCIRDQNLGICVTVLRSPRGPNVLNEPKWGLEI